MAASKSTPKDSLTYSTRGVTTLRASAERFISVADAPTGVFRTTAKAELRQKAGTTNTVEVVFEVTITGNFKDNPSKLAFSATTVVVCDAVFAVDQDENLPAPFVRKLVTPLFYVAVERCRYLVFSMGYPINAAPTKLPALETITEVSKEGKMDVGPKPSTPRKRVTSSRKS